MTAVRMSFARDPDLALAEQPSSWNHDLHPHPRAMWQDDRPGLAEGSRSRPSRALRISERLRFLESLKFSLGVILSLSLSLSLYVSLCLSLSLSIFFLKKKKNGCG